MADEYDDVVVSRLEERRDSLMTHEYTHVPASSEVCGNVERKREA